ncbi:9948_t:CDS:2, partial [Paraglomus occultum]
EQKSLLPTYYAFRWLTVLCAQEFALPEVIRLWDSVFADRSVGEGGFEFLLDFCCAMIICVKDELLDGSFADNIKLLQNYPIQDPTIVLQKAYGLREARLLAQLNGDSDASSDEEDYIPIGQKGRSNNHNDWLSFAPRNTFANANIFKRTNNNSNEPQKSVFPFSIGNNSSATVQQRMHTVAGETRSKASVLLRKMKGAMSNMPTTGIAAVQTKAAPRLAGRFSVWKRNTFTPTPS